MPTVLPRRLTSTERLLLWSAHALPCRRSRGTSADPSGDLFAACFAPGLTFSSSDSFASTITGATK